MCQFRDQHPKCPDCGLTMSRGIQRGQCVSYRCPGDDTVIILKGGEQVGQLRGSHPKSQSLLGCLSPSTQEVLDVYFSRN